MRLRPGTALEISLLSEPTSIPVGRLALDRGAGVLEYDASFVTSGLSVNPLFGMPQRGLVRARSPRVFGGLHGIFADSLPDAWGELVLRRQAESAGIVYGSLTSLDKLAIIGSRAMGALVYRPVLHQHPERGTIELDALQAGSLAILRGEPSRILAKLEDLASSSGGARPKVLAGLSEAGDIVAGSHDLPPGFTHWIVKFRGERDLDDIGPLETAYAATARAAGLEMSETRLLPARRGPGYFATKRFDRGPGNTRLHLASAAGLLDTEWSIPSIDYDQLLKLTMSVTRRHDDVKAMFRRMVFNVIAYNRDDHAKQHAFLMDARGRWRLAPAYDLTFSHGPGGEHYLAVNGKGKNITLVDLMRTANEHGISDGDASEIIATVRSAVGRFGDFAAEFGTSKATTSTVVQALKSVRL